MIGAHTLREDMHEWWSSVTSRALGRKRERSDRIQALKDINLEIEEGEVLGLIGQNGAGKSTLLKILSRITAPSQGRVLMRGRIASLLEVGTGMHPELTGRENIYLNGAILGMTRHEIASRLDEIIAFSGVEQYVNTPVKRYSSGMRVRLAFAVAAHLEPEILLVDEVLAVGDAMFQHRCIGKMKQVSKEGRTVVFVSHNMASVEALCERVAVINRGEIAKIDAPGPAIDHYLETCNSSDKANPTPGGAANSDSNVIIRGVKLLNPATLDAIGTPRAGKEILVQINVACRHPVARACVAVQFCRDDQVVLSIARSDSVGVYYDFEKGESYATVKLTWPFTAGLLTLNVNVSVERQVIASETGLLNLTVQEGDYFGTGVFPNRHHPVVLIPNEWGR